MTDTWNREASAEERSELQAFVHGVLTRATDGGPTSLDSILPLVYDEFRQLAASFLRRERAGHTLRPTALAHEAYLRLARETHTDLRDRTHLLALGATMMRRVLIDYARARGAERRGGDLERVSLSNAIDAPTTPVNLLELNDALERLGGEDERKLRVVELLYFAGLTFEEAALVLGVSSRTLVRDWRFARAWLARELSGHAPGDPLE
ncbi:MAG: ECF-type sigma factor [Candidatus Eisenbacteria bacterium]